MDADVITTMWDEIKFEVQEKNRVSVIKGILITLEDAGFLHEDAILELYKENDKFMHEAIEVLFKDIYFEEEAMDEDDYGIDE